MATEPIDPGRGAAERTLGEVVASLDPAILHVATRSAAIDGPVAGVTIFDRTDPQSVRRSVIVLAAGVPADGGEAAGLLDLAAREAAAAVVFRSDELPGELVEAAESASLTVLTVPWEMEWGQLHSLLRTATIASASDVDAAGVPVGDLFAFADAIAAAVGAPVTIEDPRWQVLAFSNLDQPIDEARRTTILGRTPTPEWQRRLDENGIFGRLRDGDGLQRFEHPEVATRLVAPIRAGTEFLGSIWVAEGDEPLSAEARDQLLLAGRTGAVHLISHRATEDFRRRAKTTQVRALLEGRTAVAGQRPPGTAPFAVVAFDVVDRSGRAWEGDPDRVLSIVALYVEGMQPDARCAVLDDRIWAVVPHPAGERARPLLEVVEKIADRVERTLGARVIAGVGVPVASTRKLGVSRRSAEQALAVVRARPDGGPALHFDDVREQVFLMQATDLLLAEESLAEGGIEDLAEYDRRHTGDLVGSLAAFLREHGDVTAAARRLSVHPNTLRYRLQRVGEVGRLDLGDADVRLACALQLRLRAARAAGG